MCLCISSRRARRLSAFCCSLRMVAPPLPMIRPTLSDGISISLVSFSWPSESLWARKPRQSLSTSSEAGTIVHSQGNLRRSRNLHLADVGSPLNLKIVLCVANETLGFRKSREIRYVPRTKHSDSGIDEEHRRNAAKRNLYKVSEAPDPSFKQ